MKVEKGGFLDVHVAFRGGIQKVHACSQGGRGHNALKVSEYRTPQNPRTFWLSSQNLLSGQLKFIVKLLPCHAMANLLHNGKKWHCKKWNFWKNQLKGFFFFQIYHPKLMSQKYNFEFFYDSALLIDPIMRLKFSFFSCPEIKFLRGS